MNEKKNKTTNKKKTQIKEYLYISETLLKNTNFSFVSGYQL